MGILLCGGGWLYNCLLACRVHSAWILPYSISSVLIVLVAVWITNMIVCITIKKQLRGLMMDALGKGYLWLTGLTDVHGPKPSVEGVPRPAKWMCYQRCGSLSPPVFRVASRSASTGEKRLGIRGNSILLTLPNRVVCATVLLPVSMSQLNQ